MASTLGDAVSGIRFEHCRIMFLNLKHWLFALAPVVALSFGVFAWAANPPKEDASNVTPKVIEFDVVSEDQPALRKALSAPGCVTSKIAVLLLSEHRSGSLDVVTIPNRDCAPVRLRLDHGRLAPAG